MERGVKIVIVGVGFSLTLFLAFLILQGIGASILELESRWLIVAGVPILLSLIIGGYIKKFKGLGVELETRLKSNVWISNLRATDALNHVKGVDKGPVRYLYKTPQTELARIERLMLVENQRDYTTNALSQYIEKLVNLKYLEIKDMAGRLRYVVAVSAFKTDHEIKYQLIEEFLNCLTRSTYPKQMKSYIEFDRIKISDKLLSILPKVRESEFGWLPVVNVKKQMKGVITIDSIESRIIDEVLTAQEIV